ncbi:hypothetical protein CEW46_21420 [Bacillus cereus]|nr:hypothetical protein CEW46_21420 [Bacillus cereus]
MLIGGYTDPHWSMNSSILPAPTDRLTPRLEMLTESYKWMYDLFGKEVDIIVDGGDLTDTPNLSVQEITALSNALSYSKGVPEYHVLGNHEKLSEDSEFSSLKLLNLGSNFHVIDKPQRLDINPEIAFYPYTHSPSEEVLQQIQGKVLFSHLTILGSYFNKYVKAKNGLDPRIIEKYFEMTINGHIHTSSWVSKKVLNLGTFAGVSFADTYQAHYPSAFILDTDTMKLEIHENPHAIRFLSMNHDSLAGLSKSVNKLKEGRYAIKAQVPYELKEDARKLLEQAPYVTASRIQSKFEEGTKVRSVEVDKISSFESGYDALEECIKESKKLPYEQSDIVDVVRELSSEGTGVDIQSTSTQSNYFELSDVKIEGFLSIGEATVNLKNRGLTRVNGSNKCDVGQQSNGSGKSSIPEAIIWALTGKTSRGASTVINMYWKGWALVELKFSVGNSNYFIRRSRNHPDHGTNLYLEKNGESISGNTMKKSEEILSLEFPSLNLDTINSIMILSQGMPNKFSSLSPAQRKSRLEEISSSVNFVDALKLQLSKNIDIQSKSHTSLLTEKTTIATKLDMSRSTLKEKRATLERLSSTPDEGLTQEEYNNYYAQSQEIQSQVNEINSQLMAMTQAQSEIQVKISRTSNLMDNARNLIHNMTNTNTRLNQEVEQHKVTVQSLISNLSTIKAQQCYACNQTLQDTAHTQVMIDAETTKIVEVKSKIKNNFDEVSSNKIKIVQLEENITDLNAELIAFNQQLSEATDVSKQQELQSKVFTLNGQLQQLQGLMSKGLKRDSSTLDLIGSEITTLESSIKELDTQLTEIEGKFTKVDFKVSVLKWIERLVARDFRSFLLRGVVQYLNHKLSQFSEIICDSTTAVKLVLDKSKLYLEYKSKSYENLSGGERQRCDIIMQFALRSLSMNEAGLGFSILGADEIFDNLDQEGVARVLSVAKLSSAEIDTLLIMSHSSSLSMPYDSFLLIEKDITGISSIIEDSHPLIGDEEHAGQVSI